MRADIHPQYNRVLYIDNATNDEWVGFSTKGSSEKREVDGVEMPVVRLDISSKSHPFWTGQARTLDAEGRIDRFKRRYARRGAAKASDTKVDDIKVDDTKTANK